MITINYFNTFYNFFEILNIKKNLNYISFYIKVHSNIDKFSIFSLIKIYFPKNSYINLKLLNSYTNYKRYLLILKNT